MRQTASAFSWIGHQARTVYALAHAKAGARLIQAKTTSTHVVGRQKKLQLLRVKQSIHRHFKKMASRTWRHQRRRLKTRASAASRFIDTGIAATWFRLWVGWYTFTTRIFSPSGLFCGTTVGLLGVFLGLRAMELAVHANKLMWPGQTGVQPWWHSNVVSVLLLVGSSVTLLVLGSIITMRVQKISKDIYGKDDPENAEAAPDKILDNSASDIVSSEIEELSHGLMLWQPNGRLSYCNPAFYRFMGVSTALLKTGVSYAQAAAYLPASMRYLPITRGGPSAASSRAVVLQFTTPDGRIIHVNGKPTASGGYVLLASDLVTMRTELRQLAPQSSTNSKNSPRHTNAA